MTDDDLREQFLKANANVDFMASQLADVFRRAMRAVASSNPTSQVYQAAESFRFMLELFARAEKISLFDLIDKAVDEIRAETRDDQVDEAIVSAAEMGMRLLVERSCTDNAARGRAAKRRSEFLAALKWVEEAHDARRRGTL